MTKRITSQVIKALNLPRSTSHKGENGRLLIIAGSKQYHGSLLYALKAASRIVDLVYLLTTRENWGLVRKLRGETAEFISVKSPLTSILSRQGRGRKGKGGEGNKVDCILMGPGMGISRRTYNLVKAVLKSGIRAVLDADALNVLDKKLLKLLGPQHILTPHKTEFKKVFGIDAKSTIVENVSMRYECTIVLKGRIDIVANPSPQSSPARGEEGIRIRYNYTGNKGMTKGGTGDVLAGLIAAFFCRNNAYTSAAAGVYLNGKAGDELYKKVGPFYNAEDLVEQIPKTLWKLTGHSTSLPTSPLARGEG